MVDKNYFANFLTTEAFAINKARQLHLASLAMDLAGKSVLEVGAGIGLHTKFFEDLGCTVFSTDGRQENVAEIRRRYPHRQAEVLDLDQQTDISDLGSFDLVYCYGTLYHLSKPEQALKAMAGVCKEMILLETCVTPGDELAVNLVTENASNPNQSYWGKGCRPTRLWVIEMLKKYFGFAYTSKSQPPHPDFDWDWESPVTKKNHRAVFVGSKTPLVNEMLSEQLPNQQDYDLELVAQLAAPCVLKPYPGWYFDCEWDRPDGWVQLRRFLWEYFKDKQLEARIKISWYKHLWIYLFMSNDISKQLFIAGCYEPNEFYFLSQALLPGMTFVDIGANDGLYSVFASKYVGEEGTVIAIEPSQREFSRLEGNIKLNQVANIRTVRAAISNFEGEAQLKVANYSHAGQNTLGDFIYEGVYCSEVETVPVKRLDYLLEEEQIEGIDVIKMDVEGAELSVLQGGQEVLHKFQPVLLLELSDGALQTQGSSAAQVLQFLESMDYEIFTFGKFTGLPYKTESYAALSGNIVAVHRHRTWGKLTKLELTQSQLTQIKAELEETQSQLEETRGGLAETRGELAETRGELAETRGELAETRGELEEAKATIEAMESSKFWQIRKIWFNVKRAIGLTKPD